MYDIRKGGGRSGLKVRGGVEAGWSRGRGEVSLALHGQRAPVSETSRRAWAAAPGTRPGQASGGVIAAFTPGPVPVTIETK